MGMLLRGGFRTAGTRRYAEKEEGLADRASTVGGGEGSGESQLEDVFRCTEPCVAFRIALHSL